MARRDEGAYPLPTRRDDLEETKPDGPFRENPSGGGSFGCGLRWLGRLTSQVLRFRRPQETCTSYKAVSPTLGDAPSSRLATGQIGRNERHRIYAHDH